MDELKQIRILNLKSWIIASLHLEYKKVLKTLVGAPIKFEIIVTRNHGLSNWKTKPKTNHFDIWSISPLNHTRQVDLNTFNLTSGFLIDHNMVFFSNQIKQKNLAAKKF